VGPAVASELVDDPVGAGVLPDDGVVHRFAGGPVPHHRRLTLVGDADRGDVGADEVALGQCAGADLASIAPDLFGVVFDPAGLRKDLLVLALVDRDDTTGVVEDHASSGRRSLVDRGYVLAHACSSRRREVTVPTTANSTTREGAPGVADGTGNQQG